MTSTWRDRIIRRGMQAEPESVVTDQPITGPVSAAISREVVRIQREYVGRGPTKAQAFVRKGVVLVLMEEVMTPAEQTLASIGRADLVRSEREALHETMRGPLGEAIERLTNRKVTAVMGASHVETDMASELFVLEPESA